MKWLERLLGPSDHRRYGDNEYYEYPRNGVYLHEYASGSSSGSGSSEGGREDYSGSSRSWRGPSLFEVGTRHGGSYSFKSILLATSVFWGEF
jgi:hypothetical protein